MPAVTQAMLETQAAELGELLLANGQRLAVAESCTGGWIAQCLTAIAGSSAWFERGFVCYSNEAKQEMLGVDDALITRHGAVSETCAAAMALGALGHSRADWAVAVSGIAGPSGGLPDKPVGTVCFAWAGPDGQCEVETLHLSGDRAAIRTQSVAYALAGLLQRATSLSV